MMTRKWAAIAITAIVALTQCGTGFGQGSQTEGRAMAAASRRRPVASIRYLKFPQSGEAMARSFGPPAIVSRSMESTSYVQHYADKVQPVGVVYRWDGVAVGISEGK